jgi:hypothetical protein
LTILFKGTPHQFQAEPLPAKRELDLVSVELAVFDPGAAELSAETMEMMDSHAFGAQFPGWRPSMPRAQNKFSFLTREGKAAAGWRKVSGSFIDRWGNQATSASAFCRDEEVLKYVVQFARDPAKGTFLPHEKVSITIDKIPGAGESIELNLTKQVQGTEFTIYGVSGTGEFTYEEGRVVSARKEISAEEQEPRFGLRGRVTEPKLFIKGQSGRGPGSMMFPDLSQPLTIAAKIPHVVIQAPPRDATSFFALVEQDTSVPEPTSALYQARRMHVSHPGEPSAAQYLPIDFRPGETDKELTFIVQKSREAEFFVKVPKRTR